MASMFDNMGVDSMQQARLPKPSSQLRSTGFQHFPNTSLFCLRGFDCIAAMLFDVTSFADCACKQ
jgi:hypothetical protein